MTELASKILALIPGDIFDRGNLGRQFIPAGHSGNAAIRKICSDFAAKFGIFHYPLQIEIGDGESCHLDSDEGA